MIGSTTIAAPVTYAAAPMSYAAPTMTTMAAPVTTTAASYVAQPQTYAMPQYASPINVPSAPVAPAKLTEGIPTPEQIATQKNGYAAALDKQLKDASETVAKETKIEKEMVKFNADKQIAMFNNQVDEKLTEGHALEDERATFALLELKKALVERNLQLSAQAENLKMDYQMKLVQTEWKQKWYAFEQEFKGKEDKLIGDYNKQAAVANNAQMAQYVIPGQPQGFNQGLQGEGVQYVTANGRDFGQIAGSGI